MGEKDSARHEREWPVIMKVAQEYKLDPKQTIALLALRETERGGKGYEMGVKAAKGTDLETQSKWAAGSIKANTNRYNQLMTQGSYKGSRRTIALKGSESKAVDPNMATYIEPDTDFIDFMWRYGSPTAYGYAPIDSPEMGEKEIELNKNWGKNMKFNFEKIKKQFSEKGVDYGTKP